MKPGPSSLINLQRLPFRGSPSYDAIRWLSGLLTFLLIGNLLSAQAGTGVVQGTVMNGATRSYLEAASVSVAGTNIVVFTGPGGTFRISNVPAGEQTLVVNYTGLDMAEQVVSVGAGMTANVAIEMSSEVYLMEEFVVAGEREGRADAITKQRTAANLVNVVASDEFTNVASGAIGEFLRNMPGVTVDYSGQGGSDARFIRVRGMDPALNSVTIDGFKAPNAASGNGTRAYEIDQVSLQNVERIEVTKAPTPAMDGDSIGGSVNLVGKSGLSVKGRRITYTANMTGPATDQFKFGKTFGGGDYFDEKIKLGGNFSYSDQLLDGKLGVVLTANAYSYYAPSPRTIARYRYVNGDQRNGVNDAWIDRFQITDGGPTTSRQSFSMNLDYLVSDTMTLFFRSQLGLSQLDNRGRTFTLQTTSVAPGFTDTSMEANAVNASQSSVSTSFQDKTGEGTNYTLGAKHVFDDWRIDYSASLGRSMNRYKSLPEGARSISFSGNRGIGYRLDGERGDPTPAFTQTAGRDVWDVNSYTAMTVSDEQVLGIDRITGGVLNVRRDFGGEYPYYIQSGLSYREQQRDISGGNRNFTFVGLDGVRNTADDNTPGSLQPFYDDIFVNQPFPEYGTPPWGSPKKVADYMQANPQAFTEDVASAIINAAQRSENADETVTAGYLMGDVRIGKLGVLGGFRYERTEVTATGPVDDPDAAAAVAAAGGDAVAQAQARFARTNTQTTSYDNLFPNLQLRYSVRPNLMLRASVTETIGRPEFSDVFPGYSVNPNFNNGQGRVTMTGDQIGPQTSTNFDASIEYYFEPVGVLSVGFFRKEIKDYISSFVDVVGSGTNNGFNGEYEGYELVTKTNSGEATVQGVEFNYSQELSALATWLQGASVFANYTYLETEGTYGGSQAPLQGFFPRAGNIGVSYRRDRFFGSVKYNWRGDAISSLSLNRYTAARGMLDISLSYKFYQQHSFYVEVKNLLSEPTNQYIDFDGRNGRYFSAPARIDFGFKGQF